VERLILGWVTERPAERSRCRDPRAHRDVSSAFRQRTETDADRSDPV